MTDPDTSTTIDVMALAAWLAEVTGTEAEVEVAPIRGGASCEMFRMERLGLSWVIRRAPRTEVSDTAHQVVREATIIQALASSEVPVPAVLAVCETSDILGAPFFVMEHVDGEVIRRSGLPATYVADPAAQPAIGEQLVDRLVDLHAFDWRVTALAELARPVGFLDRQVERWTSQLAAYRSRCLPGVDDVAQWLTANRPPGGDLSVMHGDYKLDNVLWSRDVPPRIVTVLDFEMSTVGDPLVDLAWAMIFWPEDGNLLALATPGSPGGMSAEYCQTPAALVRRYGDATGRDLTSFDWYQAFSAWKLAIVLEASYARFLSGESRNPHHEHFGFVVDQLLTRARRFAR